MTFELPELIWVWVDDPTYTHGGWNLDKESKNAPYVRGDLYSAVSQERYELSAERDHAQARAGAAAMEMRERAAQILIGRFSDLDAGKIRALPIDPDAQKALDKLLAKARLEGWRAGLDAAADCAEDYCSDAPDLAGHGHSVGMRDAILALLNEGEQNE